MIEIWINTILVLGVVGSITVLANYADKDQRLRPVLQLMIVALNGFLALYPLLAIAGSAEVDDPIQTTNAIAGVVLALSAATFSTAFLWQPLREKMARFFPTPQDANAPQQIGSSPAYAYPSMLHGDLIETTDEPLPAANTPNSKDSSAAYDAHGGFRPESMVHMWAGILLVYFITLQLLDFVLAGGLSGLAQDLEVSYGLLLSNLMLQLVIPILGVGLLIRRNPRQTLQRLGLTKLRLIDVGVAVGASIGLFFTVLSITLVWVAVVGVETFERQTEASSALSSSIDTLGLAFMVAFSAGVGEEIAFRGALQPIFGFWFTSFAFVIAHTQYTLTPAALIILIVTLVFGLIRKYFSTTTAILTHFLYNFVPLLLNVAASAILFG